MSYRLNFILLSFTLLLVSIVGHAARAPEVLLAENKTAKLPIVLSAQASPATKELAAELAAYLKRISGAAFEVQTGDGTSGIVLGTLAQFPNPSLNKALEIRDVYDGREAYAIRSEAGRVLLLGATELGTSHAVFRFLEELGYRHLFPGRAWEIVPSIPTLKISLDITDRPIILARNIWYGYGFFQDPGLPKDDQNIARYRNWARHNRMASSLKIATRHAYSAIITQNKEAFAAHPEYFALIKKADGTTAREDSNICLSNKTVRQMALKYAHDFLEKNPSADMVSLEPSDGNGHYVCDECLKMGTLSDRAFGLANEVARDLQKSHPGKLVGMLAYNQHTDPPSFALEPNVYVQLTTSFLVSKLSFEELAKLWATKTQHLGIYDYFSVYLWDHDKIPGGRGANVWYLERQLKFVHSLRATSLTAESGNNWGLHGRGYYLANRLMWNPQADMNVVLDDFHEKAFGPAAPIMKRFYDRISPAVKPMVTKQLIGESFRDVQTAATLAKERPDVLRRLDDIKGYLRYVHLRWRFDNEPEKTDIEKAAKKAIALEILRHVYRTRRADINHWAAIRTEEARDWAKLYSEPTWSARSKTPPWQDETEYSAAEIEQNFREGIAYFPVRDIEEKEFSTDLLPVRFAGSKAVDCNLAFIGKKRFLLYSMAGEPLRFEVLAGIIANQRNRPDAQYTLASQDGQTVAEGHLPLEGEYRPLELKVPKAGVYTFDFNDSGTGWRIKIPAERSAVVPVLQEFRSPQSGAVPLYFYVPKGTKSVQYTWIGGGHRVRGPDDKVLQLVSTSGDLVTIPVPPGMDGKVWSLWNINLRQLHFHNVPNYVATSPNALLLPRELIQSDGLDSPAR